MKYIGIISGTPVSRTLPFRANTEKERGRIRRRDVTSLRDGRSEHAGGA